jgi:hypothetical protein
MQPRRYTKHRQGPSGGGAANGPSRSRLVCAEAGGRAGWWSSQVLVAGWHAECDARPWSWPRSWSGPWSPPALVSWWGSGPPYSATWGRATNARLPRTRPSSLLHWGAVAGELGVRELAQCQMKNMQPGLVPPRLRAWRSVCICVGVG